MKRLLLLSLVLGLVGCTRTAHLYNVDTGDSVDLKYQTSGRGHGTIGGTLPSGETLKGEWSATSNAAVGWGNVYSGVYSANAMTVSGGGRNEGIAILKGDRGTVLNCEFIAGFGGSGMGACKDNHEQKYKLMF